MSDSTLFMFGVGIACAITAAILNIVYQIYRMANNDGQALQRHPGAPGSDRSVQAEL